MYFLADPVGNMVSIQDQPIPATPVKMDEVTAGSAMPQKVVGSEVKITLLKSERELESTCSLLAEPKRKIGVLTSGGDSSGMNAAVRAITRYALQRGCQPYAIFEGYNGLVEGGDKIKSLGWEDVRGLLSMVTPLIF
jgi:polyphosphate kinase 2 (PPK2 family)